MIKNKRILVTGGAGSIGSEIVRQLVIKNKVFLLDQNETGMFDAVEEYKQEGHWIHGRVGDVRDPQTVADIFSDFKPQYIFHAAALKHVTPGEWYPREYVNTNILGTLNLIEQAKRWESTEKFVYISTDKAVQSSSIMGATKRVAEIIVRNQGDRFVVVRFGNVLGSRGSVIPLWQKAIEEGKPIKVTDERMARYMMTVEDAVELVLQAAQAGSGGEIFCLDMGQKINILDLAKKIISESRTNTKIEMIGARPGEQLSERLMFEEEEAIAQKRGRFFVIEK